MSGFNTSKSPQGISSRTQTAGAVLRGSGPPVPGIGIVGSVYIDVTNWDLYERRNADLTNPWGNPVFTVPLAYRAGLKWFAFAPLGNSIGVDGDYCMITVSSTDYGLGNLRVCGPKAAGVWPGGVTSVAVTVNPLFSAVNTHEVA